ncbi:hypothetical protein K438DRAFT_2030416 [Mycena galopus ATCC 62051]|nr:hypothetical protein K438DRAFT_2030416 [Mycena galopus ATCC 62051]
MSRNLSMKFTPASKGDTYYKMNECAHCYKAPTNKQFPVCSACKEASFCSKECQTQAWPLHKQFCQMRKKTVAAMADAPSSAIFPPFGIRKRLLTDFIEVHECSFQSAFWSALILEGGIDNFPYSKRAIRVLLRYRSDCNENPSVAFSVESCTWIDSDECNTLEERADAELRSGHAGYRGMLRVVFRMEDHGVRESYPQAHDLGPFSGLIRMHIATVDHTKWVSRIQQFVRDGLVMRAPGENVLPMQLGKMKMKKGKWVWVQLTKAELLNYGYSSDFPGLFF